MWETGDTFRVAAPGEALDFHLWIILSNPAADSQRILIVNLTTWQDWKDASCILDPGDHPFVRHRTCINYRDSKLVALNSLQQLFAATRITLSEKLNPNVLARVLAGAAASDFIPLEHRQLLLDQGLIE